ncbi:CARDB domain-containing protein [Pyrococcus sp. ST04]|uniref:COG1470 family protein n=1 Tax=Pyrococcus sp. ST04 TaxID=1183377 RepID=UPI0002605B20|nr:CARDB domain-containing protein [Pyrococcus sp. ST04]AFK22829.1 hypothetical protein Py04_1255 [Pyrococcus sp. ST04]
MKKHHVVALMFWIGIMICSTIPSISAQPVLIVKVSPDKIEALPNQTVTINVTITNLGNASASNVTVFALDDIKGVIFTQGFIKEIPPNGTVTLPITIYILKAEAGVYTVRIGARVGNQLSIGEFSIKVKSVINYTVDILGDKKFLYGKNVTLTAKILSTSNVLLYGNVEIVVRKGEETIRKFSDKVMIQPWGEWKKKIALGNLPLGEYRVEIKTDFYGRKEAKVFMFEVYRRPLTYTAYFENGEILVKVYRKDTKEPVSGIKVVIGNSTFFTDYNGLVEYSVKAPGLYMIRVYLDGVISESIVRVEKPIIVAYTENNSLIVKVVDSLGYPIGNITVKVSSIRGVFYNVTNSEGICAFNVSRIGSGKIQISVESLKYLPSSIEINVLPQKKTMTIPKTTELTKTETKKIVHTITVTQEIKGKTIIDRWIVIILGLFFVTLGGSSYLAFFRPIITEDRIEKYYFIKVKAPRLIPLKNFSYEILASAKEAWTNKGKVRIEDSRIIWEIEELEPGEEAILQIVLA